MIFTLDCEFNSFGGELISLALVAENGSYLYLVYKITEKMDPWVKENVLPKISLYNPIPVNRTDGANAIRDFLKEHSPNETPVVISDWPDDIKYFCEAIMTGPGMMVGIPDIVFRMVRIPPGLRAADPDKIHNAVYDAQGLMDLLIKKG